MKLNKIRVRSKFNSIIKNLVKTEPNNIKLGEKIRKITEYTYG